MGYSIQGRELVPTPPRSGKHQRNNDLPSSSSNTLNHIRDEQRKMNAKIDKLIKRMDKRNQISPMDSSEDNDDDDDDMN